MLLTAGLKTKKTLKLSVFLLNTLNLFRQFMSVYYLCSANETAMKKLYTLLLTIGAFFTLTSCMNSYNVQGSSNVSNLDGRKLYLKVLKDSEFKNIDSCDVVHGQFSFHGSIDSVRLANIFMEDVQLMPVVLESGDITVKMDDNQMDASGTELNEKLFAFLKEYNKVLGEQADLVHRHDQAIMEGADMEATIRELQDEDLRLTAAQDSIVTTFVRENYDNVLGPGVFFLVTIGYQYPALTPWIEDIMSRATDSFKNDPYVKDYYEKAKQNEEIMNGLREIPGQSPYIPSVPDVPALDANADPAPTPNELAAPAE